MSFRRAAKVDKNQPEIVETFRKMGCSVLIISQLKNCADLVISKGDGMGSGDTALVEVKDGTLPPSARMLSKGEREFMESWRGKYYIVQSIDDAIRVAGELKA